MDESLDPLGSRWSSLVTVAIVPREKFSFADPSLRSILQHTPFEVPLVYVDCDPQSTIPETLENAGAARRYTLIRMPRALSPNAARNVTLAHVKTKYVAFIDNDVIVEAEWLHHLVDCAETSNAAIVGPLTLIDIHGSRSIHVAGGSLRIVEENGLRFCEEKHQDAGAAVARAAGRVREQTGLAEFHAMLVDTTLFHEHGLLDERLLSIHEHADLCLIAAEHGRTVYFEPCSIVTYFATSSLTPADRRYFRLRWSESWNSLSARHFAKKWNVDPRQASEGAYFGRLHRHRGLNMISSASMTTSTKLLRKLARIYERILSYAVPPYPAGWFKSAGAGVTVFERTGTD